MTCVVPPVEQPYCSIGENRLYTSPFRINCSAYLSNSIRPSELNPPLIISCIDDQKTALFMSNYFNMLYYQRNPPTADVSASPRCVSGGWWQGRPWDISSIHRPAQPPRSYS